MDEAIEKLRLKNLLLLWWGRLHIGELIRRRIVLKTIRSYYNDGGLILDAGCGRGDIAIMLARLFPKSNVHAVDVDPKLIQLVKQRIRHDNIKNCEARVDDITNLQTADHYNLIYSVDVFEHISNPELAMKQLATRIDANGYLIIHVPREHQKRFFKRFENYEQHDHERDGYEPETMRSIMQAAGLEVCEYRNTFAPPGALAWELFHLASGAGKIVVLCVYPLLWILAFLDTVVNWKRGNGLLIIARA